MVKELTTRLQKKLKKVKGAKLEINPLEDLDNKIIGRIKYSTGIGSFEYQLSEELCREASIKEINTKGFGIRKLSKVIKANEDLLFDMGYFKLIVETKNERVLNALEKRGFYFNSNAYKGEKILE
jgi:hypothetical protein